jgi:hypothetical protein
MESSLTKPLELTAQVAKVIHARAPDIWIALTTPATLKKFFFGADVVTDWKVGSLVRMKGEFKGKAYEDKGNIVAVEPAEPGQSGRRRDRYGPGPACRVREKLVRGA